MSATNAKIYYVGSGDVLKGRVEPIIWMRTCEWLQHLGFSVSLVTFYCFRSDNIRIRDIRKHFGVSTRFPIFILPTLLSSRLSGPTWTRLNQGIGIFFFLLPLFLRRRQFVVYSKQILAMRITAWLEQIFKHRVTKVFELHVLSDTVQARKTIREVDLVVVNCRRVAMRVEDAGADPSKILVAYNGPFGVVSSASKEEARQEIGVVESRPKQVFFTGKIVQSQLDFLLRAAELLRDSEIEFHVVGGNPRVLRQARRRVREERLANIRFHGFQPPSRIGVYLRAADFLLSVYDNDWPAIDQATPAKLFDYLLSGRPIFCSNNTAIEELFRHERNCIFFDSSDVSKFATELANYSLPENQAVLRDMVRNNRDLASTLGWDVRGQLIGRRIAVLVEPSRSPARAAALS